LLQSIKFKESTNPLVTKGDVFIFLGGHNFWDGLFDTVNIRFVRNLFEFKMVDISNVLMTTIIPRHISEEKNQILISKEEALKNILLDHGVNVEYLHIQGRTLRGLFLALREIRKAALNFDQKFIWAHNYFNCFIGVFIKILLPNTYLHFDLKGVVPEEELLYSDSNLLIRLMKFLVLRVIGRINIKFADSISVVSKRFKDYVVAKYRLSSHSVAVIPYLVDTNLFHHSEELRRRFRRKYQIEEQQKLILYSGALQKWQKPKLLFSLIKVIQLQDKNHKFRFMILSYDQEKAHQFAAKYDIRNLIIDSASGTDLNGVYNAADIGIASRSDDLVSIVSSPVKIPEYLMTRNSLILLESIGDFGLDLKDKKFALVKKNKSDLLNIKIEEIEKLSKPDQADMIEIQGKYSIQKNTEIIKKIIILHNE
jgi:glycosyltransferase involved in cell wall biosynthesis